MDNIRSRDLGEIYTPKCVAEMMKEQVKESLPDFEHKFLIWDSCWGTGNLTDVLDADDLWCSTLRQQDIDENSNKPGNKFVYDFLNDDCEELKNVSILGLQCKKLPEHIRQAFGCTNMLDEEEDDDEDIFIDDLDFCETSTKSCNDSGISKPIIFYINPPYFSNSIFGVTDESRDTYKSIMNNIMVDDRLGTASSQAYAQFMYRILKMKKYSNREVYLAMISPINYLCSSVFNTFRSEWLREFEYVSGRLFVASTFNGLSNRWGISTTLWKPNKSKAYTSEFPMDLMVEQSGKMIKYGTKVLYNLDGLVRASDFANEKLLKSNRVLAPITCSSGAVVSNKKEVYWDKDSVGFMFYKGNNVYHNITEVGLLSVPYGDGSGVSITRDNVYDIMAFFASKGSVGVYKKTYTNDKDEAIYPNTHSVMWNKLVMNSLIYGLFNTNTAFCELDTKYGKITNNFSFFDPSRLGYQLISEAMSSGLVTDNGYKMYSKALEIVEFLKPYRNKDGEFDKLHPEYQVWQENAGWYQLKFILKEWFKDKYDEFLDLYKAYSEEIKEMVYEVGFYKNRAVDLNGNYIE